MARQAWLQILQWTTNRKLSYRMEPLLMTMDYLGAYFFCLKSFCVTYLGKCIIYDMTCLHMTRKSHVACNFNRFFFQKWRTSEGHAPSFTL